MAPKRKRCTGPCGALYPPGELARVAGRDYLCPDCLLDAANSLAPAELELGAGSALATPESRVENPDPARDAPEPLPLVEDDERFAGLIEYQVEGWPLRKGRLSASALATFMRCPEQFRRQYVVGERRPSGGKAIAGTAAHATIEAAIRHRLHGHGVASSAQISATYDATYDAAVSKAIETDGIVWGKSDKVELDVDSARGLGQTALLSYYGSPSFDRLALVEAVEHTFAIMVPGVPVPICGLIDAIAPRTTVDLKFGDKCVAAIDPGWRIQARVYGLAARRDADFHSISFAGKLNDPSSAPGLRLAWSAEQAILAANVVRGVVARILLEAATFGLDGPWFGNLSHTWACGVCDFRPECPWWNVSTSDLLA